MRELRLQVALTQAEEVLDAILPTLPGGLHVREEGDAVELAILASPGTPADEELRALAGSRLLASESAEVSDHWRERRLTRYEPLVVADRFLIRPDWAPVAGDPAVIEIVLEQSSAFGTGLHPTTQACLATLTEVEAGDSLLDCGSGSGVLSIAAALLGWSPVVAVDVSETSIAAAQRNARRNEADVDARLLDLTVDPPPPAETIVANVPPEIHSALTARLERAPRLAIVSGFQPEEIPAIASAWAAHDLEVVDQIRAHEWSVLVLR